MGIESLITLGIGSSPGGVGSFVLFGLSENPSSFALNSELTATSSTATADLVASQAKTSSLTATSSTDSATLAIGRAVVSALTATTDTPTANWAASQAKASGLATTSTVADADASIERSLSSSITTTSTLSNADLIVNREISRQLHTISLIGDGNLYLVSGDRLELVSEPNTYIDLSESPDPISLAVLRELASSLTATSAVATADLWATPSLYGYFTATYFPSRYFASHYFTNNAVELNTTLKPLDSNLTASSTVANARMVVNRSVADALAVQSETSARFRVNRAIATPAGVVSTAASSALLIGRALASARTVTTATTTPSLTMGYVQVSALTATTELSYPVLHLTRSLGSTLVARSSTEAWSQSVSASWTDPTPENTASYDLEWRRNAAPSFVITGILTTSHTWSAWVDVGDVIYVRTRAVSADADPVYSEWSEWSDGWTVPSTPHRAILDVSEGTLYSIKTITSDTQNTRLRLLQQKASSLTVTSTTADVDLSVRTIPIRSTLTATTNVANADLNYSQAKVSNITVISDVANADWSRSLAIITDRTITSVTDVATLFISSSHPQTSVLTITSSTANADSIINRRISSSTTCSTNTVNADVRINRRLSSTITATSSTQTADLLSNRAVTSGLTATTLVVNGDIRISRPFQATLTSTTTTSLADAIVNRRISTNQTITSNVTNALFDNGTLRPLVSTLSINSSIDINNWWIQRGLSSTKDITTDIQSWLRIQRPIESAKTITSSTADADLSAVKLLNKSSFVTVSSDVNGSIKVNRPLSGTIIANSNGIGEIAVSRALFCTLTTTTTTQSAYLSTYLIQGVITANVTPLGTTGSPINVNESLLQSIAQQTLRVT